MRTHPAGFLGLIASLATAVMFAAAPAFGEEPFCFECHDDMQDAIQGFAYQHDPALEGDCTECHEDHGDEERLMLVEEGSALCYQCHDQKNMGKSVHPPVEDGLCVSCHSPHGSANEKFLKADGNDLCMTCHADHEQFSHDVVHGALDEGCLECHSPHSSEYSRLFTANLMLERKAIFEMEHAELCFQCHDEENFTAPQNEDTGFRRGMQNLHYLHLTGNPAPNKYGIVKKKHGQTCFGCHLPHTAVQEKLIRTEFNCEGVLCYSMRYRPTDQGGVCRVGCHKIQSYSRSGGATSSAVGITKPEAAIR